MSAVEPDVCSHADPAVTRVPRRDPAEVMRLARLGSFHQCRLSFMRQLTRRMASECWRFTTPTFQIDARGVGHAVYTAASAERRYSLIAFAHDLPPEARSDRVIAEAWDATFTLFDGIPDDADIQRLSANVPLQEAGRIGARELSLARANRSVRLWEHVVDSLADGRQPERCRLESVGYLMRTTAVYGSGKFGAADREAIAGRDEFAAPFQVEMLHVYLIRAFVRDLVEHMAAVAGGERAVRLDSEHARLLGIGNSTGLGMAPFIVNHPVLFNNWIVVREEALARVRSLAVASAHEIDLFTDLFERSRLSVRRWHTVHKQQAARVECLTTDLDALAAHLPHAALHGENPWDRLYCWCVAHLGTEAQECIASLLLEPYGTLVDGLADCMASDADDVPSVRGSMSLATLRESIEKVYGWALELDWQDAAQCARAWYVSEEKLEPRLGERFEEMLEPYEQPLAPARDAVVLHAAMRAWPDTATVAELLRAEPAHRHTVRRVQTVMHAPYAEIRDNTIAAELQPIDMLRCKLSFFGAVHFDPRSDRWLRIRLFGDAPYPDELAHADADHWIYPARQSA